MTAIETARRAVPRVFWLLVAPPKLPAVVVLKPRPHVVACFLARAIQGNAPCEALHASASEFLRYAAMDCTGATLDYAMRTAGNLRDRAALLPEPDQAPVVVAILRDLLDDAPTQAAVEMDVALVRAARMCGTTPEARHKELAAAIVAEVMLGGGR